ncbi:hypothetical protein Mth01_32120 [Sphaerimonospora thailandensis]|uniref:Uncharacterized protein n=1 Tax=Sphaerimonospora thailandensis TaxID=795644 RepID=A0A8J3RBV4_9ACTN|nr:hypothetical protein Mth01_32120 [Sphaerimonospora thailandensis]
MRARLRLGYVLVVFATVLATSTNPSFAMTDDTADRGGGQVVTQVESPDTGVKVNETNSQDSTATAEGAQALRDFSMRVTQAAGLQAMSAEALATKYRVLRVDVTKMLPTPGCKQHTEVVIVPREVTEVRYVRGSLGSHASSGPCSVTMIWEDSPADQDVQDDPEQLSGIAAAAPYKDHYGEDCAARLWEGSDSWSDSCWRYWVEKYDGNPNWNYYSAHVWSSCGVQGNYYLASCGRGVGPSSSSPKLRWLDYAPIASSPPSCRTIDNSITLYNVAVGYSYTSCEEQRIIRYSAAGHMTSYWQGKVFSRGNANEPLGGTKHHVAVKVAQKDGRPKWTHWSSSDNQYCWLRPPYC